jgi:hypothetical protein
MRPLKKAVLDRAKFNTAKPHKKTIPGSAKEDASTVTNVTTISKEGKCGRLNSSRKSQCALLHVWR